MRSLFTSESVTEGHPDKVADLISDSILDAYLEGDPNSRVAVEALCKGGDVVLGGEIHSSAKVDRSQIVRRVIREIGYTHDDLLFHADKVRVHDLIGTQSNDLRGTDDRRALSVGAADQGIVFGFATRETPSLMPLPLVLAHSITREMARIRRAGESDILRPDAKSQVTVAYENGEATFVDTVVVSTQHKRGCSRRDIEEVVRSLVLPNSINQFLTKQTKVLINPAGSFEVGGPDADCGLTGRKTMVDSYGGAARHGGGAFSGKDGTKVDRSGAYLARFVARQIVLREIAFEVEVQVAYAIGIPDALAISVNTGGTGSDQDALIFAQRCDFRPGAVVRQFGLDTPIFSQTTNYGHFGRRGLPWEK